MLYVFVDTNIYLRAISQGKEGCEREHLDDLTLLVKAGEARLLVPEVVELEVQAKWRRFVNLMVDEITKQIDSLRKQTWGTEVDDVRLSGIEHFKDETKRKKRKAGENYAAVLKLIGMAERIPLTSEIMLVAKKRMISERMPQKGKSSDQDCMIVESLIAYFARGIGEHDVLQFCSENHNDFAEEGAKGSKNYVLHSHLRDGLPPTEYSTTLAGGMNFNVGYRDEAVMGTEWDALDKARSVRRQLLEVVEEFNLPVELVFGNANQIGDRVFTDAELEIRAKLGTVNKWIVEARNSLQAKFDKVRETLPAYVQERRRILAEEVAGLFAECRRHPQFDNRSELKMWSHVKHIHEQLVPIASYTQLLEARDGLRHYLSVHDKMGEDVAARP